MPDRRHRNVNWQLRKILPDNTVNDDTVTHALLMDIRDELQKLNGLLHCGDFIAIPHKLDAIRRNTTKPKRMKTT
jgi:hypothetical protein